jgi:hypothetical protein
MAANGAAATMQAASPVRSGYVQVMSGTITPLTIRLPPIPS